MEGQTAVRGRVQQRFGHGSSLKHIHGSTGDVSLCCATVPPRTSLYLSRMVSHKDLCITLAAPFLGAVVALIARFVSRTCLSTCTCRACCPFMRPAALDTTGRYRRQARILPISVPARLPFTHLPQAGISADVPAGTSCGTPFWTFCAFYLLR